MKQRILIFGASGVGTTTLGRLLAKRLNIPHYDTDDYFWIKTSVPFTERREVNQRIELLKTDLQNHPSWIISGSLCGWGDFVIPMFTLAVFLCIPQEQRMERLQSREIQRYGLEAISPGGWFYEHHEEFIAWAAKYDTAGTDMRSKATHEQWISKLSCKVLRIEGLFSVQELVNKVDKESSRL
jgi:adenylate kinase family enzyme